jgi:hypothetical protein
MVLILPLSKFDVWVKTINVSSSLISQVCAAGPVLQEHLEELLDITKPPLRVNSVLQSALCLFMRFVACSRQHHDAKCGSKIREKADCVAHASQSPVVTRGNKTEIGKRSTQSGGKQCWTNARVQPGHGHRQQKRNVGHVVAKPVVDEKAQYKPKQHGENGQPEWADLNVAAQAEKAIWIV